MRAPRRKIGKEGLVNGLTGRRSSAGMCAEPMKTHNDNNCIFAETLQISDERAKMATINSSTISSGPDADIQQAIKFSLEKLGYEALKPLQERVVQEFLSGKDVFASLPTGYGKSLCYACLPHAFDCMRGREGSIVICVSPLTSLMFDQRAKFVPRGLLAEFVGETQCDPLALDSVREGRVQLLFISPESILSNPQWRDMLRTATYRDNLTGFVVDEAHCVKKW